MIDHYNYFNYQLEKIKGMHESLLKIFNNDGILSFFDMVDFPNGLSSNLPFGFQENQRRIEFWYIATHFLVFYSDFKSFDLRFQYSRNLVQKPDDIEDFILKCDELANRIISTDFDGENLDKVLNLRVDSNRFLPIRIFLSSSEKWDNPEEFFHDAVKCHSFLNFFSHFQTAENAFQETLEKVDVLKTRLIGFWNNPFFENSSEYKNQYLKTDRMFSRKAVFFRDQVYFYLENFSSSLLLDFEQFRTFNSPVWEILDGFGSFKTTAESFLERLQVVDKQNTKSIIKTILEAIKEKTYTDYLSEFFENHFPPDSFNDSRVVGQSKDFDIIPGIGTGDGGRILLAFSNDKTKKFKIPLKKILRRVRVHLIDCLENTRVVLVFCDRWDVKDIKESLEDLHSWKNRGVQFLFLNVSDDNFFMLPPKI